MKRRALKQTSRLCCPAGSDGWAIPANYPELANGEILRLDWFILFFQFITAVIVSIVASLGAIPQVMSQCLLSAGRPSPAAESSCVPLSVAGCNCRHRAPCCRWGAQHGQHVQHQDQQPCHLWQHQPKRPPCTVHLVSAVQKVFVQQNSYRLATLCRRAEPSCPF